MRWIGHESLQENLRTGAARVGSEAGESAAGVWANAGIAPYNALQRGKGVVRTSPSVERAPESGLVPLTDSQSKGPCPGLSPLQEVWHLWVAIVKNLEHS